jgi:hypothetical protein
MEKRADLRRILFSIILIIGFFSLTDAYGADWAISHCSAEDRRESMGLGI